jgi:hypothetical protein
MRFSPCLVLTVSLLCAPLIAGLLDPSDAPEPTASVGEGRTPIDALPHVITEPGSYVVVKNLTLSALNTDGITVSAENVTIDLNGFTLTGPGKTAGSMGMGIRSLDLANIVVVNGVVREFRDLGVFLEGENHHVAGLRVYNNGGSGIVVGTGCTVADCNVRFNGGGGIVAVGGSVVRGNSATFNFATGISATNSLIIGNACYLNGSLNISGANSTIVNNHAP